MNIEGPTSRPVSVPEPAAVGPAPVDLGSGRLPTVTVDKISDSVKPGTFVRVEPFKDGKYHSVGGVATAYRGVSIFLEGNRSAAMGAKLGAAEAHIDRAIPEGREQLENYRLYKDHNPADAYWAKQYKMPNFTSLATSGNGQMQFWLNQVGKQDDFDHELGHAMTTAGSPAAPVAWRRAMEMDRRNVAEFLTKAQIQPAKSRIPMISGANKDGLTTYAEKAFESGSLAEDWAESMSWYNRSRENGWVAKVGSGEKGAPERKLTFEQLFPQRTVLIERYLGQLDATGKRRG